MDDDRTISLIDNFLETIPADEEETSKKRKSTPAGAAVDYAVHLVEMESSEEQQESSPSLHLRDQELIDNFIEKSGDGRIQLNNTPEYLPELQEKNENNEPDEGYFAETLVKIYIKRGRYEQATEIIRRLNLDYPEKNSYSVDQLRSLEKLILNNKINK